MSLPFVPVPTSSTLDNGKGHDFCENDRRDGLLENELDVLGRGSSGGNTSEGPDVG